MAEKQEGTVELIAFNGQLVSVAESKRAARLAGGYRLPEAPSKPVGSKSK